MHTYYVSPITLKQSGQTNKHTHTHTYSFNNINLEILIKFIPKSMIYELLYDSVTRVYFYSKHNV